MFRLHSSSVGCVEESVRSGIIQIVPDQIPLTILTVRTVSAVKSNTIHHERRETSSRPFSSQLLGHPYISSLKSKRKGAECKSTPHEHFILKSTRMGFPCMPPSFRSAVYGRTYSHIPWRTLHHHIQRRT
jgi:hypothetical protein